MTEQEQLIYDRGFADGLRQTQTNLRDRLAITAFPIVIEQFLTDGAKQIAIYCYQYADAMLNEREQKK